MLPNAYLFFWEMTKNKFIFVGVKFYEKFIIVNQNKK